VLDRPADLPEFDRPPVVEVAIGVQFEAIKSFRQAHVGLFWNQIRTDYPTTQDQPRLEMPIEALDPGLAWPSLKIELIDSPPVHRAWFASLDESLLVQVQDDRLIHNWRHRGGGYPRFEPLLDLFWSHVSRYESAMTDARLSLTPIQQAEVMYSNWIAVESMEQFFRPSIAAEVAIPGIGPKPDMERWAAWYPVREETELVGRLAVEAQPARRVEDGKVLAGFQLSLTFRAPVIAGATRGGISSLLGIGRNAIVKTFAEVTTETMHKEWGRTK